MQLVERHIIDRNHKNWKNCDTLCFLSKNLYNQALYRIIKHKEKTGSFLRYYDIEKELRTEKQIDYISLPNNSSQQILKLLDTNLKSYFNSLKVWKKDKKKFKSCPQFPKYKHKTKGRNVCIFTYAQIYPFKESYIHFPKKSKLLPIKTNIEYTDFTQIRIIPQNSCYVIEVVYEKLELEYENNSKYLAIDLGVNNLAAITTNINTKPILLNGKPLKSINQYYNKKYAKIQSQLEKNHKKKRSKRLQKLTLKRNNKIDNYLHHSSKFVIDYCKTNDITNIVIGHNKNWKQNSNIGTQNNQNFVQIPFNKFIQQLIYKGKLNGIEVKEMTEAYTSKCSALDLEEIEKHSKYQGKRIKRGLFRTAENKLINADINGSLNILRKATGDNVISRGLVISPVKINALQKEITLC